MVCIERREGGGPQTNCQISPSCLQHNDESPHFIICRFDFFFVFCFFFLRFYLVISNVGTHKSSNHVLVLHGWHVFYLWTPYFYHYS